MKYIARTLLCISIFTLLQGTTDYYSFLVKTKVLLIGAIIVLKFHNFGLMLKLTCRKLRSFFIYYIHKSLILTNIFLSRKYLSTFFIVLIDCFTADVICSFVVTDWIKIYDRYILSTYLSLHSLGH